MVGVGARMMLARKLKAANRKRLKKELRKNPLDTAKLKMLGNLAWEEGDYRDVVEYFTRATVLGVNEGRVWLRLGRAEFRLFESEEHLSLDRLKASFAAYEQCMRHIENLTNPQVRT